MAFDVLQRVLDANGVQITGLAAPSAASDPVRNDDSRLSNSRTPTAHESSHVSGGSDPFLSTDILEAITKRIQETSGPTTLLMGAVADGQQLSRSGTAIVGVSKTTAFDLYVFGDGQDSSATISGNTTLTQAKFYTSLTINTAITLTPGGYPIFGNGTLTVTGTISVKGNNGAGASQGFAPAGQFLALGTDGGAGHNNAVGSNGTSAANAFGGAGGAGGAGSTTAGGSGGTGTGEAGENLRLRPRYAWAGIEAVWDIGAGSRYAYNAGLGGGGGGGDNTRSGGGGGAGGGMLFISFKVVVNNGAITANGGNGNGGQASGNCGGGGGGGGGVSKLLTTSYTGSGTHTAAGGTGGVATGTGVNGTDGSAGRVLLETVV